MRSEAIGLLREALGRLRTGLAGSILSLVITAIGTVGLFATTGLGAAGQQRALSALDTPQGRLITIVDATGTAELRPQSVATFAGLAGVEWAVGLGPAKDVRNAWLPEAGVAPSRVVYGQLPSGIATTTGAIEPGQALIGAEAPPLGVAASGGPLSGDGIKSVAVGSFTAAEPLEMLNDSILRHPSQRESPGPMRMLLVSCRDVAQLQGIASAVRGLVIAGHPEQLEVQVSEELGQISDDVVAELSRSSALTLAAMLIVTGVLIAAVQFGRVTGMTRDFGRMRALGATRGLIMALTLTMTALSSLAGVIVGVAVGVIIVWAVAGLLPGLSFCLAVGVLMLLASFVGSIAPALKAAWVDPVRILRVP